MAGEERRVKIQIKAVKKEYRGDHGTTVALNGVDLDIMENEFVCVVGPSGCGKSTLLNILAGLHHRITDGMITTMAIACDIEIDDGDTEERYEALKTCLQTLERYECNRLR